MVLGESGKRLSKRDGAEDILEYRHKGYLNDALINYLVRLGWSYEEEEIFSLEKLEGIFDLSHVNSSPSKYSQDLLNWYNNKYLNFLTSDELIFKLREDFKVDFGELERGDLAISLLAKGANTLKEISEESKYFFQDPLINLESSGIDIDKKEIFMDFKNQLSEIDFQQEEIESVIGNFLKLHNLKFPELGKPLRMILTGKQNAPSISELLFILGKDISLKRIEYSLND